MAKSSETAGGFKFVVGSLGTLLVAGLIAWGLWPNPEYVEIGEITKGQFAETVTEDGVTRIKDIYTVSAPVSGRLLRNDLKVGARVEKLKTIVARIRPAEPAFLDVSNMKSAKAGVEGARAAIALAQSNLASAKERRRFTQNEYNRNRKNKRKGRITKAVLDRVRFDRNLAREAVKTADAKLAIAREDLKVAEARVIRPGRNELDPKIITSGSSDQTAGQDGVSQKTGDDKKNASTSSKNSKKKSSDKSGAKSGKKTAAAEKPPETKADAPEETVYSVLAPVDGRVLTILQGNAQTVPAGTPLLRIGNPEEIEITVDLLSRDAVRVQPGAKAFIDQWGGEQKLQAEIIRVEPTGFPKVSALGIVEQRVKVVLELKDGRDKWQRLGHDFHVQVHIIVWAAENIVSVPVSALFRRGDDWAVFVVENDRAELRQIEIGHRNRRFAEVKTGLSSTERAGYSLSKR